MSDHSSQSNSTIAESLLLLTESLNESLPRVNATLTQAEAVLTPEQFDSLIASW
jgi:hypothetical protein